jgi:hypothetical protein
MFPPWLKLPYKIMQREDRPMKISSSSSNSVVNEQYIEQLRKAQQQKQQVSGAASSGVEKVAAEQSAETKSGINADDSDANQETSSSSVSIKGMSSNVGASAAASSDTDTDQALITKANSGRALTESELSKLKQISPAVYARAMKAQKAREELRGQMDQNPSNATQIARAAISQNKPESKETEKLIDSALTAEYQDFISKHDQIIISGR